jgi:uncharacterized Tic20 family protein
MPHTLSCPICRAQFQLPDELSGVRRFRCPHCQRVLSTQEFPHFWKHASAARTAALPPELHEDQLEIVEDAEPGTRVKPPMQYDVRARPRSSSDSRTMALLCHLGGIFTSFVLCLIVWLVKRDESRFVDEHGKEALNFQLTTLIVFVALILVRWVLSLFLFMGVWTAPSFDNIAGAAMFSLVISLLWMLVMLGLTIMVVVFAIQGAMAASNGQMYRYPINLRMVR